MAIKAWLELPFLEFRSSSFFFFAPRGCDLQGCFDEVFETSDIFFFACMWILNGILCDRYVHFSPFLPFSPLDLEASMKGFVYPSFFGCA
jgi:hypothetical protein